MAQKHLVNKGLGILGKADDIELWSKIVFNRKFKRFISSKKCNNILVIAGGQGSEVDALVKVFGEDIVKKIWFNDKFICFTNRIKRKYPAINIVEGDFMAVDFKNKQFDVILGNPPYQETKRKKLWPMFSTMALEDLLAPNGFMAFITPSNFLYSNNSVVKKVMTLLKKFNTIQINNNINNFFPNISMDFCYYIVKKNSYEGKTIFNHKTEGEVEYNIQTDSTPMSAEQTLVFDICDKISNPEREFYNFEIEDVSTETIKAEQDSKHKYFVIQTTANQGYTTSPVSNDGILKLAVNISASYNNMLITKKATGGLIGFIRLSNKKEGEQTKNYLLHPLMKFYADNFQKTSGFKTAVRRSKIPVNPNVDDLYSYFGLTEEQKQYVQDQFN